MGCARFFIPVFVLLYHFSFIYVSLEYGFCLIAGIYLFCFLRRFPRPPKFNITEQCGKPCYLLQA